MMKKTPALILTAIAAVLAVLALIFYLTSGVTMAYVTALSAGAIVACSTRNWETGSISAC